MLIFSPDFFKSQISIVSNFPILYKVDCFIACPKIIIFTLFLFFKKLSKTCWHRCFHHVVLVFFCLHGLIAGPRNTRLICLSEFCLVLSPCRNCSEYILYMLLGVQDFVNIYYHWIYLEKFVLNLIFVRLNWKKLEIENIESFW